ncbi:hypothetical protein DRE_06470 [Drechslerella stenobrocha 248]|uniref:Protein MAK16 n=1 Tax=Drechslerella stenobrocha 248 TaxID=1043628 RepID=W7HXI9_9PEZI|nr:hypothetical protein DRE_06470 [Drechslerella stenobrocha 248]
MASDEIVWQIISHQFCAFKLTTPLKTATFCRNEHNVTGLCNRQSCPLANSRYATVRADPANGRIYLYMKTVERAHLPSKTWERILLSENYAKALEQVDERLIYWPKFLTHKCKQRLTRLVQVAIKARRVEKEEAAMLGEKTVPVRAPKIRRREATRERKALAAARLERQIEKELVERLRSGAYGDKPLNVEEGVWKKVLRVLEKGGEAERDEDFDEEREEELEDGEGAALEDGMVEYVSGDEGESDEEDMEDFNDWLKEGNANDATDEDDEDDDGEDDISGASDFEDEEDGDIDNGASDDDDDSEESGSESDGSEQPAPAPSKAVKPSAKDLKRKRSEADVKRKMKKRVHQNIEYEEEHELPAQTRAYV